MKLVWLKDTFLLSSNFAKKINDNVYVKERIIAAMESTNILQDMDDEIICLE
jgi:hypothetical protein